MAQEETPNGKTVETFFFKYKMDVKKPLSTNDLYAVSNHDKSNSLLEKLVQKYLPGFSKQGDKYISKKEMLEKIISPLKTNKQDKAFKQELSKLLSELRAGNKKAQKEIKEFYKNYKIDVEKPLYHTDIYAYLNKVDNGVERLSKILNKELPATMDKNFVINEIVKPLKEQKIEKPIKEGLIRSIAEANKSNEALEKQNEKVKEYFQNYPINAEKALWDKDIYAFLQQGGKEAKEKLSEMVKGITGDDITKGKMVKAYVIKNIVIPIKEAGKEQEFKESMLQFLNKGQEQKQEKTQKR